MLYEVNLGIRDYFTYTDAMLNNSLFSDFLQRNGLNVYKGESTRDVICLDFDFGSKSYNTECKRLNKLLKESEEALKKCDESSSSSDKLNKSIQKINQIIEKVQSNKLLYLEKKRDEIREEFYENGVDVTYKTKDKNGDVKASETIHYKMLYRTSAKAKLGQAIFINEKLYKKAYEWLTMGLGDIMPEDNAKIVEMSAYAPLTTSTIINTMHIPVQDILILSDQDSFFKTMAKVIKAENYTEKIKGIDFQGKKCVVVEEETEVKNTVWDGMGLIDNSILPDWINGMALLRNHFFKMCGFKTHIQKFFQDWCLENGHDYNTYEVQDMFGKWHYLKDIKVITTDNSIKWKKFSDLMGNSLSSAYEYWCNRIQLNGNMWGIVKTDHLSKLGEYQQLSYQMINTLPCEREEVKDIAQVSIDYVEKIKMDNEEFEKFLRKYANEINHYEMLADLYKHNPNFANSKWFRSEKTQIIRDYVYKMRTGKIMVNGDNLTICGNPYALLIYSVGDDWTKDPTLNQEDGCIQCYTTRFNDGEYLAAFRNPHNSPNNICHLHNTYSYELSTYFEFSKNILVVNSIGTDIQDRCNGCDYDSDFLLVTNQSIMVKYAAICYKKYFTIVNALKESGMTYQNTKVEYARMDNKFSKCRLGIGQASNLAQLAMTYYWTELQKEFPDSDKIKELYDNFIILSVLAQVIIDGCKREYEIDGMEEINRISKLDCMTLTRLFIDNEGKIKKKKCDFPEFMKYTREIKYSNNGKDRPYDDIKKQKEDLKNRVNYDLVCPMNWLEEYINKIQNATTAGALPTEDFFNKMNGKANDRQMSKIMSLVVNYDNALWNAKNKYENDEDMYFFTTTEALNEVIVQMSKIKINNIVTINRLIEVALGLEIGRVPSKNSKYNPTKYTRKILNLLYKTNRNKFFLNFSCEN